MSIIHSEINMLKTCDSRLIGGDKQIMCFGDEVHIVIVFILGIFIFSISDILLCQFFFVWHFGVYKLRGSIGAP